MVTFFGIADSQGCLACPGMPGAAGCTCSGPTPTPVIDPATGLRVFYINSRTFLIVVEGKKSATSGDPAMRLQNPPPPSPPIFPDGRPDLQIEASNLLGNGDPAVICASGNVDGVPSIQPPDFGPDTPSKDISSALADFSCRFTSFDPSIPCTLSSSGNPALGNSSGNPSIQFCSSRLGFGQAFPPGDTTLTVRLRDFNLNVGPPEQLIVRVVPP